MTDMLDHRRRPRVAVTGLGVKTPAGNDLDTFWSNLRLGVEAIQFYSEQELLAAGELLENIREPSYVRASAPLDDNISDADLQA